MGAWWGRGLKPRPSRPPGRLFTVATSVAALAGAALVAGFATGGTQAPAGLTPATVADQLSRIVPDAASGVRVNNVYGSGHGGAWQFVAHLSWHGRDGSLHGGAAVLPRRAGQLPLDTRFPASQLAVEEKIGWTLDELSAATNDLPSTTAPLAMLEYAPTPETHDALTYCRASGADVTARCVRRDDAGDRTGAFTDRLTDDPSRDELSVQRASHPVSAERRSP
jgi:hypothetical protein